MASTEGGAGETLRSFGVTPEAVLAATLELVGTPHDDLDASALAAIGIDLDLVREKVEAVFGTDALTRQTRPRRRWRRGCSGPGRGHVRFTPRAKRCLKLSLGEALALRHRHIGAEHIALALTAMTDGLAPRILPAVGAPAAELRSELLHRYRPAA